MMRGRSTVEAALLLTLAYAVAVGVVIAALLVLEGVV